MKVLFITTFFISCMFGVMGQSFIFNPTDTYEATVDLNTYTNHQVFMTNQTGEELILAWELLAKDIPADWEALLCDFGGCYAGIPDSGKMSAISDTIQGYLRLTINPFDQIGTGTATFKVYDNKHPLDADTLSITIHAMDLTSITKNEKGIAINVYPNPAYEVVNYAYKDDIQNQEVFLINQSGKIVLRQIARQSGSIDVSQLPQGLYYIRMSGDAKKTSSGKVLLR